jgi:DNA-binding Lrp family transcriptional regulator
MKYEILKLLARNARYTPEEIATMLNLDKAAVETAIKELEKDGVLRGYKAVVDWDKFSRDPSF